MIDINKMAEMSLSRLECNVVYQYPEEFATLPVVSYYNVAEKGGFYADNSECIQDGYVQIDVWSKKPAECGELSIKINEIMTEDGWTRELSMDIPRKDENIYHRTMRFQKYFQL